MYDRRVMNRHVFEHKRIQQRVNDRLYEDTNAERTSGDRTDYKENTIANVHDVRMYCTVNVDRF